MRDNQAGTDLSVLVVALYQEPCSRKTFIPLVRSDEWPSPLWRIPGGGAENGETSVVAATNQLHGETGLKNTGLLYMRTIEKKLRGDRDGRHCQMVFVANVEDTSTFTPSAVDGCEVLTAVLFPLDDILDYLNKDKPLNGHGILPAHANNLEYVFQVLKALPD